MLTIVSVISNPLIWLQIIWVTQQIRPTQETDLQLLAFFLRAVNWCQAKITVITVENRATQNAHLELLRVDVLGLSDIEDLPEFITDHLLWRGFLSFTDSRTDYRMRSLPGMEILATCKAYLKDFGNKPLIAKRRGLLKSDFRKFSAHLKVISTVNVKDLPDDLPKSSPFILRTSILSGDSVTEKLFEDPEYFSKDQGLLTRLYFQQNEALSSTLGPSNRTFADFKKALAERTIKIDPDEGLGRNLESLLILIVNPDSTQPVCSSRNCLDKLAYVIDPEEIWSFYSSFHSDILDNLPLKPRIDAEWDEKRLLSFLECRAKAKTTGIVNETMCPAEDFILMEAAELLKLFNPDGSAKSQTNEILEAQKKTVFSCRHPNELEPWPAVRFQDFFGLHYNRSEASEEQDRDQAKLIRQLVGSSETFSTCHSDRQSMIIQPRKSRKKKSPRKRSQSESTNKRKSHKEGGYAINRTAPKVDVFKKKLRIAVYEVLHEKGIPERHKLFRPCFRNLFQVVDLVAKSMTAAKLSTETLKIIAKNNAELVITMQKGTLTKAKK